VRRFCAAWSDNIGAAELAAFFTDDAVYHNIPLAPVTGRDAIANTIASFIRPGAPGIESIEFRVINIAANGPVVMTERVDVFRLPNKSFELQVMGSFEVSHGKINGYFRGRVTRAKGMPSTGTMRTSSNTEAASLMTVVTAPDLPTVGICRSRRG
jgi:limonene-1,2-epoxide hydrolase